MTNDATESNVVSELLVYTAYGLFLIFLVSVIVDIFPLQVLKPSWQFNFNNRLVGSGVPALIGFCFLNVAALLSPGNLLLKQRLTSVRAWAFLVAIGFFLLIPLQGFATWRFFSQANAAQATGLTAVSKQFSPVKMAIAKASSTNDMRERLARLNLGIRFTEEQLNQPLPKVRESLLSDIERLEIKSRDNLAGPNPEQIWSSIQSSTRVIIAALGYSLAFAAGAQRKGQPNTLLNTLAGSLLRKGGKRRRHTTTDFPSP